MSEVSILDELRSQLQKRDDVINMMKTKTKEYVQKLKDEHAEATLVINKVNLYTYTTLFWNEEMF